MSRTLLLAAIALAWFLSAALEAQAESTSPNEHEWDRWSDIALERGDCRVGYTVERRNWRALDAGERNVEWLTAAGPTAPSGPLSFGCLRILAVYSDDFEVSEWCAPLGSARVSWTMEDGTPPFRVSIDNLVSVVDSGFVDIHCDQIKRMFATGNASQHRIVTLRVVVRDAAGRSISSSVDLGLVSAAPTEQIESIGVLTGYQDAHFMARPWPFQSAQQIGDSPVGVVAIVRYRALSETTWTYLLPLPPPSQSGCGHWCAASHVNDLLPDTDYEAQGAWMWHSGHFGATDGGGAWWELEHWKDVDGWWRSWTTPEALTWSEPHRFRTFGDLAVGAEATSDTVRVTWPASRRTIHALAYSPDWPGTVWVDRDNSYQWRRGAELEAGKPMSALIGGLPADTQFEVLLETALPWQICSGGAGDHAGSY